MVRVYILDAYGVPPKDRYSLSDPYMRLKLGRTEINEKDNYIQDSANPEFYKCYELKTSLPGASLLKI